jgi:hypothetical protein
LGSKCGFTALVGQRRITARMRRSDHEAAIAAETITRWSSILFCNGTISFPPRHVPASDTLSDGSLPHCQAAFRTGGLTRAALRHAAHRAGAARRHTLYRHLAGGYGSPVTTIASRFRGPPTSGNGGYSCGVVAGRIDGPAEVTLRHPPPLDEPLEMRVSDTVRLLHGDTLIAEGRRVTLDLDVPTPPSLEEARARVAHYAGFHGHPFPTCFVCGPERAEGDGLRIFPGRLEEEPLVAAPWVPHPADADATGRVRPAILWAALDCPGYFGAATGKMALLGRMAADVRRDVPVGEPCVVIGWKLGEENRKIHAGTALFDASGELLGRARQTWVVVK